MHDLIIRGGRVVDGTGRATFSGDIVIDDGRITAVGDDAHGSAARRTIEADGLMVTPGWVDIHTHYDGQATWDEELAPTSHHGVTTIVMGNCGVGFAPVAADRHEWLIGLMEGVEDIPGTALAEGMTWGWETFPEYLDALTSCRWTVDVGTQVPHGAVRTYVMGERGAANEPAGSEEILAMKAIVKEALEAGALGFSTSRTIAHWAIDGEPVPGTFAANDELFGICEALSELGRGVFELAPAGSAGEDVDDPHKEMGWMRDLSAAMGRPVTFALQQVDPYPDLWRAQLAESLEATAIGANLWPQVAGRPTGLLSGHHTSYCLFDYVPAYRAMKQRGLPADELFTVLSDPNARRTIVEWEFDVPSMREMMAKAYRRSYLLGDPPDYEPSEDRSIEAVAAASGTTPAAVAYDAMLADGGMGLLYVPILNYSTGSMEPSFEMLSHPRSVIGLGDGGAHVGIICDASTPTFMLTHWTRDRNRGGRFPVETIVSKQTRDTARLFGLADRGTLEPGMQADVNLIDYDHLALSPPRVAADLPAGGKRLLQEATGYVATIKKGTVTFENGHDSGERPGRLLRAT